MLTCLQIVSQVMLRFLGILLIFAMTIWPIQAQDRGGSYLERTTAALAQLDAAERALAAGDTRGIQTALGQMGVTASELSAQALRFRDIANRERARCGSRVEELERRIGQISTDQEKVSIELDDLEANLASTVERERLSSQQVEEISRRLTAARNGLEERNRKIEELNTWWWVPGYNLYLGIRTLADQDIEQANSLANTLRDQNLLLNEARKNRHAANQLRQQLQGQIAAGAQTVSRLKEIVKQSRAHDTEIRQTATFLTTTEAFWSKASTLLQARVGDREQSLQILLEILSEDLTLSDFTEEFQPTSMKMREALLEFAESVDNGSNFLQESSTDYCGGPPRDESSASPTTRCNIAHITRYFKIVNPATCTFTYDNPPGCPPEPKVIDKSSSALQAGRQRGLWTRSPDQNWVGRASTSPCKLEGSIYYGKLAGLDQCEAACQSDPLCIAWTYNHRNGYLPDSIRQCWGATSGFNLEKSAWSGFESGGIN